MFFLWLQGLENHSVEHFLLSTILPLFTFDTLEAIRDNVHNVIQGFYSYYSA